VETPLAVALFAGAVAAAQGQSQPQVGATVMYTLQWESSSRHTPGALLPGWSANFRLTVELVPAVNTVVPVGGVFPSAATLGTLRGIMQMFIDLRGMGGAEGSWTNLWVDPEWDLTGAGGGMPVAGGTELRNIQAGVFAPSWPQVLSTNPVHVWSGTWTPASYQARTVTFSVANGHANPSEFSSRAYVQDGASGGVPTQGTTGQQFGSANIPIIPAPPAVVMLAIGIMAGVRRRSAIQAAIGPGVNA
jgi:hypothetical protein